MNPPPLPAELPTPERSTNAAPWVALFFAMVFGLVWLANSKNQSKVQVEPAALAPRFQPPAAPIVLRAVVLTQHEDYDDERKRTFFTGLVTNNTPEAIAWLSVEYSLYDESGAKIGRAVDSMQNLGPFEVWRFKAENFERDVRRYRFEGLTMR